MDAAIERRVAGQHHAPGDDDGEDGADQRVQPRPPQIRKPQALVGNAALLKEQLPRGNRRAHDRNHEEDEIAGHPTGGNARNQRVMRHLSEARA